MAFLRRNAWLLFFGIGIVLLVYAYDNIVVLPGLPYDDAERGWAWLTSDPEVIDYIKFWFRNFGIWVLAVAVLTLVISATGYRTGHRWAFYSLLYLPVHAAIHLIIMPWLMPILVALLITAIIGLALPFRQFFPRSE